jgi:uncharacterized membrane protein YphA (DoxX/SURF4 family)
MTDVGMWAKKVNWILLGLVMLVAGALKLFVMGADAVAGMLSGLGFPGASALAWVLIVAEIASGILILARYKLEIVTWVPVVILVVAAFTAWLGDWGNMLIHLALASNYVVLGQSK